MSITSHDAVLILGAGVSAPFHLPLGGSMIDKIRSVLARERQVIENRTAIDQLRWNRFLTGIATSSEGLNEFPIRGAVARKWKLDGSDTFQGRELRDDFAKLLNLERLLEDQTSETIDDFIVENPDMADLAKIAIASELFQSCYLFNNINAVFDPREFQKRHIWNSEERNWIHLLINTVRQGIRNGAVSDTNPVNIITFNYDGVLERVLDLQFSNTGADYPNWKNFIKIHHVHGHCGEIEHPANDPAQVCLDWASNISVVNESTAPPHIIDTRNRARELVQEASKVYAVGFAFARPNVEMLGLHEKDGDGLTISYCNWDGNAGLRKAVERIGDELAVPNRIGMPHIEEASGAKSDELSVTDWFRAGYAGDLPG